METFNHAFEIHPQWVQPKASQRRFELRAGESLFATLEFKTAFGSLAAGESSEGRWTFKRVGFFNPSVTVRREGEETDLAVYKPNWTGSQGPIQFADGRAYLWKVANFWATQYTLSGAGGEALVTYRAGVEEGKLSDAFKSQARVELDPAAAREAHPSLLALLGWYLILLQQEDSTAAVIAATAAMG